jgi:predicted ATPase
MTRILITGMSGAGKTTVLAEPALVSFGHLPTVFEPPRWLVGAQG